MYLHTDRACGNNRIFRFFVMWNRNNWEICSLCRMWMHVCVCFDKQYSSAVHFISPNAKSPVKITFKTQFVQIWVGFVYMTLLPNWQLFCGWNLRIHRKGNMTEMLQTLQYNNSTYEFGLDLAKIKISVNYFCFWVFPFCFNRKIHASMKHAPNRSHCKWNKNSNWLFVLPAKLDNSQVT